MKFIGVVLLVALGLMLLRSGRGKAWSRGDSGGLGDNSGVWSGSDASHGDCSPDGGGDCGGGDGGGGGGD